MNRTLLEGALMVIIAELMVYLIIELHEEHKKCQNAKIAAPLV